MTEQNQETPIEIWNKLSEDGKRLATAMAPGGGLSFDKSYLEAMAEEQSEDVGHSIYIKGILRASKKPKQ